MPGRIPGKMSSRISIDIPEKSWCTSEGILRDILHETSRYLFQNKSLEKILDIWENFSF